VATNDHGARRKLVHPRFMIVRDPKKRNRCRPYVAPGELLGLLGLSNDLATRQSLLESRSRGMDGDREAAGAQLVE
jgi:hypothetical protein